MPFSSDDNEDEDGVIIVPDEKESTKTDEEIKDEIKEKVQIKQDEFQDKKTPKSPSSGGTSNSANLSL